MNHKYLISQCARIREHYDHLDRLSGDQFNVFRVIGLGSEEVRLHSAFLAELLDPNGSHGQGDIFLKAFVERLEIADFDTASAIITREKYIGPLTGSGAKATGGSIDIFLEDKDRRAITIENKIYAGDQRDQLHRYYNFNNDNLLYLTLDGHTPNQESAGSLQEGTHYRTLSYADDISGWLENCQKESYNLPAVREGIQHYLSLIKSMTNQSRHKEMTNELLQLITESKANIQASFAIANQLPNVKAHIQQLFWNDLADKIIEQGYEVENIKDFRNSIETLTRNYSMNQRNSKYYGLFVKTYEKENTTIYWGCELDHHIYTGFILEQNGKKGVALLPENKKYVETLLECDSNYSTTEKWLGWQYTTPKLNFHEFNSNAIFSLLEKEARAKIVSDIVNKMVSDTKFLIEHV
ncbi:MAG: PD-(D/E)XK nuclease family protein [Bacteroidales bacterium]